MIVGYLYASSDIAFQDQVDKFFPIDDSIPILIDFSEDSFHIFVIFVQKLRHFLKRNRIGIVNVEVSKSLFKDSLVNLFVKFDSRN